ncbi:MAG: hypothetical protein JXM69_00595 [Anaerolineae bacterium]|nr:hypothetical protein [Anaerolineae bacterium]
MSISKTTSSTRSPIPTPRPLSPILLALATYFLLTIFMTWPMVLHLTNGIPGDGFDGWQNVWNLWWIKRALLVLRTSPYFTHEVYYPTGAPLYFQTLNIFNGLAFLPFALTTSLLVTYNLVVLFSFAVGGFGAYLLALYTLRGYSASTWRPGAAFLAGVVYTFSPYHFAHLLGHLQLISLEWLPFYALFLLKALEQVSRHGATPPHHRLAFYLSLAWKPALFLILIALCDWYYAFYMVFFTGLVLLWTMWVKRIFWPPLGLTGLISVLFVIPLSPLLTTMIHETLTADYMLPPPGSTVELSADLLAFVSPNEFHPLWGEAARRWGAHFSASPSEHIVFAGYTVLALTGFAVGCAWRRVRFWAISALVFLSLALGPILHVGGQTSFLGLKQIPLPYSLLDRVVPLLFLARSISRFDVVVMLCLGILAAHGLNCMLDKLAQKGVARGMTAIILVAAIILVCFEFLSIPYPISKPETHPFHFQLAQDTNRYAILDLPMDWDRPANMLYQTTHGKAMISAYTPDFKSRPNPLDLTQKTPILQHFRYLGPDIIAQDPALLAPTVLNDLAVRYVLLHKSDLPPGDYREKTIGLAEQIFAGWPIVFEDDWLRVYETPPRREALTYLSLGNGWSNRQVDDSGQPFRTFSPQAELRLHHPQPQPPALEITISATAPQRLTLLADGESISQIQVTPEFATHVVDMPPLTGDIVTLTLTTSDPDASVSASQIGLARRD